jgi:hypothetical protein
MPQSPKSAQFVAPIDQSERVLADGRVLVPGEPVDLDDDAQQDPHNARLIEEGQLLEIEQTQTKSGGEK